MPYLIGFQWFALHVQIPDLYCQVITCHQVPATVAKFNVRDGGDDFREKGTIAWVFWLLKN